MNQVVTKSTVLANSNISDLSKHWEFLFGNSSEDDDFNCSHSIEEFSDSLEIDKDEPQYLHDLNADCSDNESVFLL